MTNKPYTSPEEIKGGAAILLVHHLRGQIEVQPGHVRQIQPFQYDFTGRREPTAYGAHIEYPGAYDKPYMIPFSFLDFNIVRNSYNTHSVWPDTPENRAFLIDNYNEDAYLKAIGKTKAEEYNVPEDNSLHDYDFDDSYYYDDE